MVAAMPWGTPVELVDPKTHQAWDGSAWRSGLRWLLMAPMTQLSDNAISSANGYRRP